MLPRLLALAGALALLSAIAPRSAGAAQVYLVSVFVHRVNANCVQFIDPGTGALLFRCRPYTCDHCPGGACGGVTGDTYCDTSSAGTSVSPPNALPSSGPEQDGLPTLGGLAVQWGNVSNDPHIEFEVFDPSTKNCVTNLSGVPVGTGPYKPGATFTNVCNSALFLCATVGYGNADSTSSTPIPIDQLSFEIFKFTETTNPLDPASAPPLRTFFVDSPGYLSGNGCTSQSCGPLGPFCVLWDANINVQGEFGQTNGDHGFRAPVQNNQTGASGNIQITAIRAYPGGATLDALNGTVSQLPITVDVTNVHAVRSSATLVGSITQVFAQPYNITYRLSKDATTFLSILDSTPPFPVIRTILPGTPRVGEGIVNGGLTNGDSWDGRDDHGQLVQPGVYMAVLQAFSRDQFGDDLSLPTTREMSIDPLQITDIRIQPLLELSTSVAVLDYILTEPSTVFIDIYPPSTQF